MATAEPHHLGGHARITQRLVVGHRLRRREQVVDGALQDQRRGRDVRQHAVGPCGTGEAHDLLAERRALARLLSAFEDRRTEGVARTGGPHQQRVDPRALDGLRLVEARPQRVPGDHGNDGIDTGVDRGGGELDAATVGAAGHPDPGVACGIELCLGPGGHPGDERRYVAALEVRVVQLRLSARRGDPSGVPGQHVVSGLSQVPDARDRRAALGVGIILGLPAEPRALQNRGRHLTVGQAARGKPVERDGGAVEGHHRVVVLRGGRGRRAGD